jgi:hypothetical protein
VMKILFARKPVIKKLFSRKSRQRNQVCYSIVTTTIIFHSYCFIVFPKFNTKLTSMFIFR